MFTTEETKDDFNSTILNSMNHVQVIESAIMSARLIAMGVIKEI